MEDGVVFGGEAVGELVASVGVAGVGVRVVEAGACGGRGWSGRGFFLLVGTKSPKNSPIQP